MSNTDIETFSAKQQAETTLQVRDFAPERREKYKAVEQLANFLKQHHPENILMWVEKNAKRPVHAHKSGQWKWENFLQYKANSFDGLDIAILLKDLVVIDIDNKELIDEYESKFPILKACPCETTRKGGHYYFKRTQKCDELKLYDLAKCLQIDGKKLDIDFKTITSSNFKTAGVLVCAPSSNKKWIRSLLDTELPELPEEMADFFKKHWSGRGRGRPPKSAVLSSCERSKNTTPQLENNEGQYLETAVSQNNTSIEVTENEVRSDLAKLTDQRLCYPDWTRIGWALSRTFKKSQQGLKLFTDFSKRSKEYFDEKECEHIYFGENYDESIGVNYSTIKQMVFADTFEEQQKYWQAAKADIFANDQGFMRIFVKEYKDKIAVVSTKMNGYCYMWNETTRLWLKRENLFINSEIADFLEKYINKYRIHLIKCIESFTDKSKKAQLELELDNVTKVLIKVRSSSRNTYEKVLTKLYVEKFEENLNKITYLLPIRDKLAVDLRTGDKIYRNSSMYFSFECPIDYVPDADLTRIETFFRAITKNDEIYYLFLQKVLGYAITGEMSERVFFICFGQGLNGKGTLFEALRACLLRFYVTANKALFVKPDKRSHHSQANAASPHLIDLKRGRMAVFSEMEAEDELNEADIRRITGGDTINARQLYHENEEFVTQDKLFIQTNHLPKYQLIESNLDRVIYLPFEARFVANPDSVKGESKIDPGLKDWLASEGKSLLLTWVIKGAVRWYKEKLGSLPECCRRTKDLHVKDLDIYSQFIEETLERADAEKDKISSSKLWEEFSNWCRCQEGLSRIVTTKPNFKKEMDKRLGKSVKCSVMLYKGWKLIEQES